MRRVEMTDFPLPTRICNERGEIRRLGIELEFAGLDLDTISDLIVGLFGGRHCPQPRFAHRVTGTRWGDFVVEVDTSVLKDQGYLKYLHGLGFDIDTVRRMEDLLERVAATLVPHEIASPPIPMTEAHEMERLRESLRQHQALGTRASLRYAFGLHFNPEVPALDAVTLLAYLRAFLLLVDLLESSGEIDVSRRVTPYINDFPQSYIRLVLNPSYRPSREQLIDDYLYFNPTRNRPLDMLPLFAFIDRDRVLAGLNNQLGLVKPRPAFHYRLPNCLIDEPAWTLANEWRGWVRVEQLARDPQRVERLSRAYLAYRRRMTIGPDLDWADRISREVE